MEQIADVRVTALGTPAVAAPLELAAPRLVALLAQLALLAQQAATTLAATVVMLEVSVREWLVTFAVVLSEDLWSPDVAVQAVLAGCFFAQRLPVWGNQVANVGWTLNFVPGVAQGWLVVLALIAAALDFLLGPTFSMISEDAFDFWMRLTQNLMDWQPALATVGQYANDPP